MLPVTPPILYTEQQAAEAAQVSRRMIRRLIEDGRLEAVDYGRGKEHYYRITPEALTRVKPKSKHDSPSDPAPPPAAPVARSERPTSSGYCWQPRR